MHRAKLIAIVVATAITTGGLCVGGFYLYKYLDDNGGVSTSEPHTTRGSSLQTSSPRPSIPEAKSLPHFIFVLADDLGFGDIGYNNKEVITPNLDRLAREGMILNNNYAQPICTPSRASFLTGRYPFTIGMQHGNIGPSATHCAPTDVRFLSDILQEGGYQTHMAGKWHLGHCKWECTPIIRGFTSYNGPHLGMVDHYTHIRNDAYDWRNNTQVDFDADGGYSTELVKNRTLMTLDTYVEGEKPIFMYVAFTAPHTPIQAQQKYKDMYPNTEEPRRTYLAMISALDGAVAEIVDKLREKGMWDNTLFVFSSDNGGAAGGQSCNLPLRSMKGTLFEGGTRIPGFVSGPLVANKGTTTNSFIQIADWGPTFLKMANISYDGNMDGIDQTGLILDGGEGCRDEVIYHIDKEWTDTNFHGNIAIRQGDWKIIWGWPGSYDGYGTNITKLELSPYYLALINKTLDDYDDPSQPQQKEFRKEIARTMGVHNITEQEMEEGRGHVMLFNLKDDPEERYDLSGKEDNADRILQMKRRVMQLIKEKYVSTNLVNLLRTRSGQAKQNGVWTVGWCDDINTDLPSIAK